MAVSNLNLYLTRGDTRAFSCLAQDYNQNIINLTGATILCDGRLSATDASPVFSLSVGAGITVVSAVAGTFTVTIPPSATLSLANYEQTLQYDVKVTDSSSNVTTVQSGKIYLTPDISY